MLPVLLEDRAISSQTNIGEAMAENTVVTTVPRGHFQLAKIIYVHISRRRQRV